MTTKTDAQGSLRSLLLHGILFISNDEILEEDRQAEAEKLDMVEVCIRAKDEFLSFSFGSLGTVFLNPLWKPMKTCRSHECRRRSAPELGLFCCGTPTLLLTTCLHRWRL